MKREEKIRYKHRQSLNEQLREPLQEIEQLRGDFLDAAGCSAEDFAHNRAKHGRDYAERLAARRELSRLAADNAQALRAILSEIVAMPKRYGFSPDVTGAMRAKAEQALELLSDRRDRGTVEP